MPPTRVTIRDVAKHAGVSIGTVSNSLNNAAGVGAAVRARVLSAAAALGYHPNRAAQATRTGRTRTLAFVTPDLRNPFYPQLAQSIAQAARQAGYALLIVDTQDGDDEREHFDHIVRHGVDGILWCPATGEDVTARLALHVPVVVIDHWLPGRDTVAADYRLSGRLIAEHAFAGGYRSIGLLSGPPEIASVRLRRDHLLDFLGGRIPIAWEVIHPFDMRLNDEATRWIRAGSADLVICCDDLMALGAVQVAREAGLTVPRDLAIIGHDDLPISSAISPAITTIRQPLQAIGRMSVELLLDRLEDPDRLPHDVTLDVSFIARQTTS